MDFQRLISVVAENPPLWNKKNRDYTNRLLTDQIWETLASDLNHSKEECKKKWKYLKDEYRKALRKLGQSSTGVGASQTNVSRFKYFDLLSFLRDNISFTVINQFEDSFPDKTCFTSYPVKSNMEDNSEDVQIIDESSLSSFQGDIDDSVKHNASTNGNSTMNEIFNKRQYVEEVADLGMERKKQKQYFETEESDDLHFFKSLLPYVRDLPPTKKLCLRSEFLKIVVNFNEDYQ